jgi:hypothetical protein
MIACFVSVRASVCLSSRLISSHRIISSRLAQRHRHRTSAVKREPALHFV